MPILSEALDLPGPEFLRWYPCAALVGLIVAMVLRCLLRGGLSSEVPYGLNDSLGIYDKAYLAGGAQRAIMAALSSLYSSGTVKLTLSLFRASGPPPVPNPQAHPSDAALEAHVVRQLGIPLTLKRLVRESGEALAPIREALQKDGLVMRTGQALLVRFLPTLVMGGVILIGCMKMQIGTQRHRPIGFLGAELIVVLLITLYFATRPTHRTRRGDLALKELEDSNAGVKATAEASSSQMQPRDAALAVALFGVAVLPALIFSDLREVFAPPRQSGDGGGGSGCSSSSCSSGDSGGSSCGGGGCGGCGGGD